MALINGNLVLPARREDLKRFLNGLHKFKDKPRKRAWHSFVFVEKLSPNVPKCDLSPCLLCGFSPGEACFHARVDARNYRFEYSISQTHNKF